MLEVFKTDVQACLAPSCLAFCFLAGCYYFFIIAIFLCFIMDVIDGKINRYMPAGYEAGGYTVATLLFGVAAIAPVLVAAYVSTLQRRARAKNGKILV